MKSELDLSQLDKLPAHLRRLLPQPEGKRVPFDSLTDSNAQKASNYVKTKTIIDLFNPPPLQDGSLTKGEGPIILVLCQPSEQLAITPKWDIYPYTPVSFPNWLEGAGARCIPLPYNINEGSMHFLFERAHGLLLPGGGSNLYKSYSSKEGHGSITVGFMKMWRCIQKMWAKGINFPIWGTCLGLQLMLIMLSNDTKVLSQLNNRGYQCQIYPDYDNSTILRKMPLDLRINLEHRKLINNHHVYGISIKKFMNTPKLVDKLRITGISRDQDGRWFCTIMEGRDRPIYLTQYHPQKQAYQWGSKGDIVHNKPAIQISQFMGQSFLLECMKCRNQKAFSTMAELQFYTFQQFRQIYTPQKLYKCYAIDFKFREYDKEHRKKISQKQVNPSSKKIFI